MLCKSSGRVAFATTRYLFTGPRSNFSKNEQADSISAPHVPVMVQEVLQHLNPKPGQVFLDMTFGAGGHTKALFDACSNLTVVGLDQDPVALEYAHVLEKLHPGKFFSVNGKFSEVDKRLVDSAYSINSFDCVIMDLGVSSMQLDSSERGFGFRKDSFLDMRMTGNVRPNDPTAADVLNTLSASELSNIFKAYGEERCARRIANAIVDHRISVGPIRSTGQLADLIVSIVGPTRISASACSVGHDEDDDSKPLYTSSSKIHVATRVFQALRIFVNNELNELCCGLEAAFLFLKPGGRVAVISFHSLEDRIVKWAFGKCGTMVSGLAKHLESISLKGPTSSRYSSFDVELPDSTFFPQNEKNTENRCWHPVCDVLYPSDAEVFNNRRSRSAKLRIAQKI